MAVTAAEHLELPSPEQQQDPTEVGEAAPDAVDGDNGDVAAEEELPAVPVWPPLLWAREAVIQSLAESLSSPSSLFKKYGPVPLEEAAAAARRIEQEAFAAVSSTASAAADDDGGGGDGGMETLNDYSKEISKRIVDFCRERRATSSSPTPAPPVEPSPAPAAATAATPAGEKAPPVESEAPGA